jgi:hypothetical protein
MYLSPVCANLSTSSILVATGMVFFSFCNPSLGPTSTIETLSARLDAEAAKVLRWHGWRAARRAERRQVNLEDMSKYYPMRLLREKNAIRDVVLWWRAIASGDSCGDDDGSPRQLALGLKLQKSLHNTSRMAVLIALY